jgi:hypothetical protein
MRATSPAIPMFLDSMILVIFQKSTPIHDWVFRMVLSFQVSTNMVWVLAALSSGTKGPGREVVPCKYMPNFRRRILPLSSELNAVMSVRLQGTCYLVPTGGEPGQYNRSLVFSYEVRIICIVVRTTN